MLITAIICTYNRVELLLRAIESLAEQTLQRSKYEILIVDNGSVDQTKLLVEEKQQRIGNLIYLSEPAPGLARARNAGVASSKGDIVAFLDDDAIATPTWLESILYLFRTLRPSPGLLYGPVEAIWGGKRPDWLKDDLLSLYSVSNGSGNHQLVQETKFVFGTNMAIPRDVILKCGGFNENLGRKGRTLLCGEETALKNRIRSNGYKLCYDPSVVVHHFIHPDRLSKKWLYKRIFWGGITHSIREQLDGSSQKQKTQNGRSTGKKLFRRWLSARKAMVDSDHRLRMTKNILEMAGQLYGRLRSVK